MTPKPPRRSEAGAFLPAVCLSFGLLAAPYAFAQGGGGGSGGASGGAAGGSASGTAGGAAAGTPGAAQPGSAVPPPAGGSTPGGGGSAAGAGQGAPGQRSGQAQPGRTPRERIELQQEQRSAGPSSERAREQLEDLNELSRQLAPGAPVPAPGAGNR